MADKLYKEEDVARIAGRLNHHLGENRGYKLREMADGVDALVKGVSDRLDGIIEKQAGILELEPAPEVPVYDRVSEGLEYSFGGYSYDVIGRGSCTDTVIVIPETYDDGEHGEKRVLNITGVGNDEDDGAFANDQIIEEIVLPESGISLGYNSVRGSSLKIVRNYAGGASFWSYGLGLKYVSIVDGTNISIYDFNDISGGVTLDFSRYTSVPELSDVSYINAHEGLRILVPVDLYDEWVADDSTNWVALKEYIYPVLVKPEGVNNKLNVVEDGVEDVYEKGKQAEWNKFWDGYQDNGNRNNYQYGFSGFGWRKDTFKPKHSIIPETINTGFWRFGYYDTDIENATDFVEVFDRKGLVFDTSKCNNFMSAFMWATIKRLCALDVRADTQKLSGTFSYGNIKIIEKLIVDENTLFSNNTFQNQAVLEEIRFEGVIAQNNLNFQWSKNLSKASKVNIIGCLSTTTSGLSITFSKQAVNKAFETSEGANDGFESTEWANLVATRSNWTIQYA